eukprot:CAMPEP_0176077744 /NCGR_PEP_ID=MMETSP0120_2-20121206/38875_1 /TAXON_ID=160619 /ORGANISM="Kryptoperidinium foliaceum, Strain CCMP 1326" /LENGTH=328 /DNA_ID=CAMNT_0017411483 /DNA_START=122 /DNA_END=1108 /DNA_ORIENTATION=+
MRFPILSSNTRMSSIRDTEDFEEVAIPVIQLDTIFRDYDLIADMDSVLNEIAIKNSMSTSPSNMTFTDDDEEAPPRKPRGTRNLSELMPHQHVEKVPFGPSSSTRQRLESTLDVEVQSRKSLKADALSANKENADSNINVGDQPTTQEEAPTDKVSRKKRGRGKKNEKKTSPPVVWVIEPDHGKTGMLRFKFTTDAGACLVLKAEEALASIDIMKESSRSNTYFQVYSIDRTSSRVMLPEQIERCMQEIAAESKPTSTDDSLSAPKSGIAQRFYLFMLRRRWRKVVQEQVRIASGGSNKPSNFSSLTKPFTLLWNRMTRRGQKKTVDV